MGIARITFFIFLLLLAPAKAISQIQGEISLGARELEPCRTHLTQLKADVLEHYRHRLQEYGDDNFYRDILNELSAKDPLQLFIEGWSDSGQGFGMPYTYTEEVVSYIEQDVQSPLDVIAREDLSWALYTTETWSAVQNCIIGVVRAKSDAANKAASSQGSGPTSSLPDASATPARLDPPRIVNVANLGTSCVRASLRNVKVAAFDASSRLGELVLTNSCGSEQAVIVNVDGLGMLGWPAIYNSGSWAATSNADVPAGLPFTPIIALSESPSYLIGANSEYVATQWMIPTARDEVTNEIRVWIASCDSRSASGHKQVIFRPAPHFMQDARAQCASSRIK
jgi:hypothetical protein